MADNRADKRRELKRVIIPHLCVRKEGNERGTYADTLILTPASILDRNASARGIPASYTTLDEAEDCGDERTSFSISVSTNTDSALVWSPVPASIPSTRVPQDVILQKQDFSYDWIVRDSGIGSGIDDGIDAYSVTTPPGPPDADTVSPAPIQWVPYLQYEVRILPQTFPLLSFHLLTHPFTHPSSTMNLIPVLTSILSHRSTT